MISFDDLILLYNSIKALEDKGGSCEGAIAIFKNVEVAPEFSKGKQSFIKLLEDFYALNNNERLSDYYLNADGTTLKKEGALKCL